MKRGRILVVDDEIYIVHILDFALGMEGYEVVTALDGADGIEKAMDPETRPDLVVLDLVMPKMDGFQVCRALKEDGRTKEIPVIMLTARATPADQMASEQAGVDEFISKPFSPKMLVNRIDALLGQTPAEHAAES